ncbi:MAG: DUF1275 domain-containing protein [Ruminococcus sp.]|nr:DUF1275 domain-containing protein [Ruminococcus sp.]
MKNGRHIAEYFGVGAVLTFVGGFLDAYTYICRDGVFANAQTGNMVLMAIRLTEGRFGQALHYLLPILSFAAGVLIVEKIKALYNDHPRVHWHRITVIAEMAVILAVGFLPSGMNSLANILVSMTSAMQMEGFRRINGKVYVTTMCTGNLRSGTESLFSFFHTGDKVKRREALLYYSIILIFILGAALGAFLTTALGIRTVWLCIIGEAAALILLMTDKDK